jgi:hypothetical protein
MTDTTQKAPPPQGIGATIIKRLNEAGTRTAIVECLAALGAGLTGALSWEYAGFAIAYTVAKMVLPDSSIVNLLGAIAPSIPSLNPYAKVSAVAGAFVLVGGLFLSACGLTPAAIGGLAAAGAAATATITGGSSAGTVVGITEATVCNAFGTYYAGAQKAGYTPPTGVLLDSQEALANFCSANPAIGSTNASTLASDVTLVANLVGALAPALSKL